MIRYVVLLFSAALCLSADTVTLDFAGLTDGAILSNQYPGVIFSNAIILSAGISLNEFEFPPHSDSNVVSDNGGPITIDFAAPVLSFGGFFTYAEQLSLQAFDASNNQVASATSAFLSNLALSGDPGSSPNEFLQVTFPGSISSIRITGDPAGGSFVLDDAALNTSGATVPEPAAWPLILTAMALLAARWRTDA